MRMDDEAKQRGLLDSRFRPHAFLQIPQNFPYMEICTAWIFKRLQIFQFFLKIFIIVLMRLFALFSEDFIHNE